MAYKLVGYFENWAQYRQAGGKFLPAQINASLFTHINFAFGLFGFVTWSVDRTDTRTGDQRYTGDFTIQPVEWDDQSELYPALQKLKGSNPSLKTLLSIGGWSMNSGDDQPTAGNQHPYGPYTYRLFSQMSANPAGRTQFITSAISYAQQYGFDGIDIDWEYPAYLSRGGTPDDLANFLTLVQEFRASVPSGFLLTMAAPAIVPTGVPQQYHADPQSYFAWLAQCAAELDWLNVMTYDFHGAFDPITGVNAPLAQDSVPGGPFSIANTVKAYLAAAIPKEKIVVGMPTYGRSFSVSGGLTDSDHSYGKPATAAPAGPATATPGVLAYYEIAPQLANGDLVRVWDDATLTPYAYSTKSGEWVTYDDTQSLAYKAAYVNAMGLGGAMVWAIDDDDFQGEFPLIQEIKSVLDDPSKGPQLPAGLVTCTGDWVPTLTDAIRNALDLGNARTSALNVLFFVCAVEGNIDATKFINNNKVEDVADPGDAQVFRDAACAFSALNDGLGSGASDSSVLGRFRTALDWDLGNHTSAHNVSTEWDNYLFADDAKMQGYYSVGYQLHFEQNGEAAAKALDSGVERTATLFHYIGFVQPTPGGPRPPIGISRDTTDIWVEQPGNVPSDTLTLDGVKYRLDKGRDGKPVSRQQQITDLDALNQAIAQDYVTAEINYTPQYDAAGNLQNAEPVRRLAQYVAQTQYHSESLTHSNPQESDHDAMQALLKLFGVTSDNYQDILNAAQSDNSTLRTQSIVAQVVESFVPFATLIGSLVQYGMNKTLLDWKKRETQMQDRATFYIDEQEKENEQVMMGAAVQSVFDIAVSIIGPGEGLLVTVLKGVKNYGQKAIKGGSAFAQAVAAARKGTSAFRQLIGDENYAEEAAVVEEIKNSHPALKSISTERLVAVRGYTSRDYQPINVALRIGDPAELARLDPYIKAATDGLSQLPSYTGTVWRGAHLTNSIVANYADEEVVTERAFVSTSADFNGYFSQHNTDFVIQSNGGGKDVSLVSNVPGQKEVLFPPGTQFKVLSVEKSVTTGKTYIYLNELK